MAEVWPQATALLGFTPLGLQRAQNLLGGVLQHSTGIPSRQTAQIVGVSPGPSHDPTVCPCGLSQPVHPEVHADASIRSEPRTKGLLPRMVPKEGSSHRVREEAALSF